MKVFLTPLILCLVSLSAVSGELPKKKATPPDIFLVTIDTLRADHVHCYGYEHVETPALDALAKDGVRFTQAFTPSPITNTSHTTILTGLLPSTHGVTDFAIPLAPDHTTLAEMLRQQGYHTAAFIGAVILDSKSLAPGLDRGFDYYDNFPEHPRTKARWGRVERRGMDVVQHAEAWLTAHPTGSRFVWVHLYDPHDPYEPPAPFSQTYKGHLYDGEIAYADSSLAAFVAYLKKNGKYQNALLVVVGDHGEGLGEHHEDTHGIFLYDSTTHVPLIIKRPAGAGAGKVVAAQVRTLDILPTVIDMTGASSTSKLDGLSLKSYLTGSDESSRVVLGQTDYPMRFGWAPIRSVRTEGFKLIEAPRPELYNLQSDPSELENKFGSQSPKTQQLRAILAEIPFNPPAPTLPDPKDRIEEQNLLHAAMIASEDNRAADARSALEEVLQLDPRSPTALRQIGELELQAGDYSHAAQHLKAALELRPDDATAAFYEGQARAKNADFGGAREALEKSLKLMPGQFPPRLLLGQVYLSLKDAKAAEDQFEAALLLQSNSLEAELGLARAKILQGRPAEAAAQLEALAKSHPKNPELFELLSQAYTSLGKTTEAHQADARADQLREAPQKPGKNRH